MPEIINIGSQDDVNIVGADWADINRIGIAVQKTIAIIKSLEDSPTKTAELREYQNLLTILNTNYPVWTGQATGLFDTAITDKLNETGIECQIINP